MKAVIRGICCADVPDLRSWQPPGPDRVAIPLELEIGPEDESGTDLFQVLIVTQQGLRWYRQTVADSLICPCLFVLRFDWRDVELRLNAIVDSCTGPDWPTIVDQLRRHFQWEYEGYILTAL
jgi:hypothetical protein